MLKKSQAVFLFSDNRTLPKYTTSANLKAETEISNGNEGHSSKKEKKQWRFFRSPKNEKTMTIFPFIKKVKKTMTIFKFTKKQKSKNQWGFSCNRSYKSFLKGWISGFFLAPPESVSGSSRQKAMRIRIWNTALYPPKPCGLYLVCEELPEVEDLLSEKSGEGEEEGVLTLLFLRHG